MKQRSLTIDTLRGLACILLVAFHVVGANPGLGLRLNDSHVLAEVNDSLAFLRMPLFSFLSGFVYAWRPYSGNPGKFVKGKFRRLLVPMLLVGTFFALLQSVTPGANSGTTNWYMLHIMPVAHFWFLEALFLIFMLTAALEHTKLLSTPAGFLGTWVLASAFYLFNPMPDYLALAGAAYLLPFFLLGLGCNRYGDRLSTSGVVLLGVALLVVCAIYLFNDDMPDGGTLTSLFIGVSSSIVLLRLKLQSRFLAAVGAYSFGIYLFHTMFTAASRIALTQLGVDSLTVLFVSGLIVGIAGPVLATMALRRIPLGHWPLGESAHYRGTQSFSIDPAQAK